MFAFLLAAAVAALPAPPAGIAGAWRNPRGSVVVQTGPCGPRLCGWIVRANAEAMADAKDAGIAGLIGTALLRDYRPAGANRWAGTVYVPDMGRSFGSTITLVDRDTLSVKGCLIGGFICRTQDWHRD